MRAAVFYGTGQIRVEEKEIRQPAENEVVIEVKACGVCGTDAHIYAGAKGATECNPPVVLGHEFAGVVYQVGNAVTRVKIGDHVTVDPSIMCEKCFPCQEGTPHFCEAYAATGVNYDGGFAQFCTVLEKQIFKLDKSVPFEVGAMCEPVGCCLHGIDMAEIKTGATVLIIGAGTIGLIMLQLAKLSGAGKIIVLEPQEEKCERAKELGADITINPITEDVRSKLEKENIRKVNVTIECVGRRETMRDAIKYAGQGATVVLFGVADPDCEIPVRPFDLFKRELTIKASFVNPYCHGRAAELIGTGKLQLKGLISDIIPLEHIDEAFELNAKNGKMIIVP